MKRFSLSILLSVCTLAAMQSAVVIDGNTYVADTIMHRQVGPGIVTTILRLPDYPLNVYITETDLNHEHNRVESTIGYNTVGRTEALANAYTRNRTDTWRPVAGCNGNFWCVSGNGSPTKDFELGAPFGFVIRNQCVQVNCENNADQWNGGPTRTGAAAISRDKKLYMGHFASNATIRGGGLTSVVNFNTVNRRNLGASIVLWTPAYTSTREFETNWPEYNTQGEQLADNYYLTFKEGFSWAINENMHFYVSRIVKGADRQTLGNYDACLTATGTRKAELEGLSEGDEIVINYAIAHTDGTPSAPLITNMVEGNAPVMIDGELLNRNYDETYNSQIYSRTAYGSSADGKHLYFIVIDKSTSKLYGRSAGTTTAHMCQILKSLCPDVVHIMNMDAGGSAEMMLNGAIINTTTEGNPRAVACGWLVGTEGPVDNEIAEIQFWDWHAKVPTYSSYTPRIVGFNQYGEVVNDNLQGFTLSCPAELGYTEGQTLVAGSIAGQSSLTANYNGLTATVPVTTIAAQPAIAVKPVILTDNNPRTINVTATVVDKVYNYDPAKLQWSIDDASVATLADGVITGKRNGETRLECRIGDLLDIDSVRVEISPSEWLMQPWDGWTLKGAGAKNITLDENGNITFTYSSNRAPYLQLSKDVTFYSLPDAIELVFTSSLAMQQVQVDMRNRLNSTQNYMAYAPDGGYPANVEHVVSIDLQALGGADNLATYPLELKAIKFTPVKSDYGDHTLALTALRAHYNVPAQPTTPGDVNNDQEVTVADVTAIYNIILGLSEEYRDRADVNNDQEVTVADVTFIYDLILGN